MFANQKYDASVHRVAAALMDAQRNGRQGLSGQNPLAPASLEASAPPGYFRLPQQGEMLSEADQKVFQKSEWEHKKNLGKEEVQAQFDEHGAPPSISRR